MRNKRISQLDKIARMLRKARAEERAVDIREMMRARVSAFNGIIMILRRRGYDIKNQRFGDEDGIMRSQYRLIRTPEEMHK
jgi:hypothetical protein